jgi:AmmeMemoRadiSam system protein B/AmmeMemoRadiSam system protein A
VDVAGNIVGYFAVNRPVKHLFYLLLLPFFFANFSSAQTIRQPETAGAFYPAGSKALTDSLDAYLAEPMKRPAGSDRPIIGMIVPHAGYQFSGRLAAHAYRQLADRDIKTVIVLGPSHRQSYSGAALHSASAWQTPLGTLQVDTALEHSIQKACPFVHTIDSAFTKEHSIEDQLPFIQKVLGHPKIVPIAMGAMQFGEEQQLASALAKLPGLGKEIVIIASSDMSHYLTQSQTVIRDSIAFVDVIQMDPDQLAKDEAAKRTEFCGEMGVLTLMLTAEQLGGQSVFLGYTNSALITGDTTRVVGYGAFGFIIPEQASNLTTKEQQELLSVARKTVDTIVLTGKPAYLVVTDSVIRKPQGAFVTLIKKGQLRGCIGYMLPTQPLAKSVYDAAQQACTSDDRFPPVTSAELKDIRIEVSTLSTMRRIRSLDDIIPGTTGLYVVNGDKRGVLLPQVAIENKWTRDEFLRQLAIKAGMSPTEMASPDTKLFGFTAQVFSE